jgi:branched-chain amino acid aminotransferase
VTGRIWWNGVVGPFADAMVHVTSETAQRGVNAFEGLRAYWLVERGCFAIVSITEHLARLRESLRLLSLPAGHLVTPMAEALRDLLATVDDRENLYLRPTIYLEEGSYTSDPDLCRFGSFVSCRAAPSFSKAVSCHVSSYRRVPPETFPPRAKSGASYSMFRLARLEATAAGHDESILLNDHGNVTETGGASVFLVIDGAVVTPALKDGILDSITRRHVLRILRERLALEAIERSVSAQELLDADEVFLTGTLDEVRIVERVHGGRAILNHAIGSAVREEYLGICHGRLRPLSESMLVEVRP